jgi:hypothetical protein
MVKNCAAKNGRVHLMFFSRCYSSFLRSLAERNRADKGAAPHCFRSPGPRNNTVVGVLVYLKRSVSCPTHSPIITLRSVSLSPETSPADRIAHGAETAGVCFPYIRSRPSPSSDLTDDGSIGKPFPPGSCKTPPPPACRAAADNADLLGAYVTGKPDNAFDSRIIEPDIRLYLLGRLHPQFVPRRRF